MPIFKKIVFGLNVVGPQGVNAPNDFIVGETTDGETGVLVGESLLTTEGLKYIDESGQIHTVEMLPSTEGLEAGKQYKLVVEDGAASWVEDEEGGGGDTSAMSILTIRINPNVLAKNPQTQLLVNGVAVQLSTPDESDQTPTMVMVPAGATLELVAGGTGESFYESTDLSLIDEQRTSFPFRVGESALVDNYPLEGEGSWQFTLPSSPSGKGYALIVSNVLDVTQGEVSATAEFFSENQDYNIEVLGHSYADIDNDTEVVGIPFVAGSTISLVGGEGLSAHAVVNISVDGGASQRVSLSGQESWSYSIPEDIETISFAFSIESL